MAAPVPPAQQPTRVRYVVLAALCTAAAIAYVHRTYLSVPQVTIASELKLTTDQMGWIMWAFPFAYALGQLPAGWLGDRFGTRKMLPLFAAIWSAAAGGLGIAQTFGGMFGCQIVNGLGQAGIFPCCVKTISQWLPASRRAMANGLLASCMSVGAMVASALIGFLLRDWHWHIVFLALSTVGFVWAIAFFFWFRDRPEDHPAVNAEEVLLIRTEPAPARAADSEAKPPGAADARHSEQERAPSQVPVSAAEATPWLTLLSSSTLLLICAQQFFRAGGYYFYQTWFPTYLQKTREVSQEHSGYLTGMALGGVVLGSLAGGFISDWIHTRTGSLAASRKGVATAGVSGCALFMLLAYFIDDALVASSVIACGAFCAGVANPVSYALTIDLGGKHVSMVFSIMNMVGNLGAMMSPKFVSWLVEATKQTDGTENWSLVLLLLVGMYAAATVLWLFINPKKPILRS